MRFLNKSEIYQKWVNCIRSVSTKSANQWTSVLIDERLVIFAFEYASKQVASIKNRIGSVPYSSLENVFYNKLAELSLCILFSNATTNDILSGNSVVSLNYDNKDERYKSDVNHLINDKSSIIAGTIKYTYPIVNKYPVSNHVIVYVDAVKPGPDQTFPFANINNGIKMTILGCATPNIILKHNDNSLNTAYSNSQTSFYGFDKIEEIRSIKWKEDRANKPCEYITAIMNMSNDEVKHKLDNIKLTLFSRACPASNMDDVDFSKLFDPIIKKA